MTAEPGAIAFAWPIEATRFVLEQTGNLSPPVEWNPVATVPTPVGGFNTLRVEATEIARFFRLRLRD